MANAKKSLRAIILDNDETTGSYYVVFALIFAFQILPKPPDIFEVSTVLERLALWMLNHNCFRPGLLEFLKHIVKMRNSGHLDGIIMYTNQKDFTPQTTKDSNSLYPPLLTSPPHCISYMMSYLVQDIVFDHILTRPDHGTPVGQNGCIAKQFKRVLDLYPEYSHSCKNLLFFDDLATPEVIRFDGLQKEYHDLKAYALVPPYVRILTLPELTNLSIRLFDGWDKRLQLAQRFRDVYTNLAPTYDPGNHPTGQFMIDLVNQRFGVSKDSVQPSTDGQGSQASNRETQGSNGNSE